MSGLRFRHTMYWRGRCASAALETMAKGVSTCRNAIISAKTEIQAQAIRAITAIAANATTVVIAI